MARLLYAFLASLDGAVVDEEGSFAWAAPDDEVHAAVNEISTAVGTFLLGRRMYEVLSAWETMETDEPTLRDFASIWRNADKVVYSKTLDAVSTARTRIERRFDLDDVRRLKDAADRDLSIAGPTLAAHAIRAGLVDEWHLFLVPYVAGGGTSVFPPGVRRSLTLLEQRRFTNGTVYLRYRGAT